MADRMQNEITALAPTTGKVECKNSVWIGGSILGLPVYLYGLYYYVQRCHTHQPLLLTACPEQA